MKNQSLNIFYGLFLLIIFFSPACSDNKIKGSIYLDENGNKQHDDGEDRLASLQFTVTQDDREIKKDKTNNNGNFQVDIDKGGTYCVIVDQADLNEGNFNRVARLSVPEMIHKYALLIQRSVFECLERSAWALVESDCSNGLDDDNNRCTDCCDPNCREQAACQNFNCGVALCNDMVGNNPGNNPDNNNGSDNNNGQEDDTPDDTSNSDDSKKEDEVTGVISVESKKVCAKTSGGNLKMDVPVSFDYSSKLANISEETIKVDRGDSFVWDLIYPESCSLSPLTLTSYVEPTDADLFEGENNDVYSSETNEFDLQQAVRVALERNPRDCERISLENPVQDTLRQCHFNMKVKDDGSVGDLTVTFSPTALCPGEVQADLPKRIIEVDGDKDFEVVQNYADTNGGDPEAGDAITVTTNIKNNSNLDFDNDAIELLMTTASEVNGRRFSATCQGEAHTAKCSFDLASGGEQVITTDFNLPNTVEDTKNFSVKAELKVEAKGQTVTFTGNEIVITVQGAD